MIKKIIKRLIRSAGYELEPRRKVTWLGDEATRAEFDALRTQVEGRTMVQPDGLRSLYDQAVHCEKAGLEGDFVECGVWKGGAVGVMAGANLYHGRRRRAIHLFDSFEEICEPDASVDGERALREAREWSQEGGTEGRLVPLKGIYDHKGGPGTVADNLELLSRNIGYPEEHLHFHQGWFQHTLPERHHRINQIALLRLDADWYASTKICLEYLFPKVVSGGFVVIDDYGSYDGCRKAVDEYLATLDRPFYLHHVNHSIRYIIAP